MGRGQCPCVKGEIHVYIHTHIELSIERTPMGESKKNKNKKRKGLPPSYSSFYMLGRIKGKEETCPGMLTVLC